MLNLAPIALLMSGLLLCCLMAPLAAQSCTSCGPECVSACGSRRYRTCCFNYLRKRRSPVAPGAPPTELADITGPGSFAGLAQGGQPQSPGDGLPEDLRVQLVLLPNERLDQEAQDPVMSATFLHHLLESQPDGGGSVDVASASSAAGTPPPVSQQRRRAGGGAGRDWLADLRRRVGLEYNE